jgi:hypothetical protein
MTDRPLTEQFIHGIVNFRDCWYARFGMHNCCDEDFWEWLSTGHYDMYVHPFLDYDPWNLTGRDSTQSVWKNGKRPSPDYYEIINGKTHD